jgi:hypothetical protein
MYSLTNIIDPPSFPKHWAFARHTRRFHRLGQSLEEPTDDLTTSPFSTDTFISLQISKEESILPVIKFY